MRRLGITLLTAALGVILVAGCGDDGDVSTADDTTTTTDDTTTTTGDETTTTATAPDDAGLGERLHVFGDPEEGGERFTVRTVERTVLCRRSVTDGLCV